MGLEKDFGQIAAALTGVVAALAGKWLLQRLRRCRARQGRV